MRQPACRQAGLAIEPGRQQVGLIFLYFEISFAQEKGLFIQYLFANFLKTN